MADNYDQYEYADEEEEEEEKPPPPSQRKRKTSEPLTQTERAFRARYVKSIVSMGDTRGLTDAQLLFLGFRQVLDEENSYTATLDGAQRPVYYQWVAPQPEVLEAVVYENLPDLENVKVPRGFQLPVKKPCGICEFPSCNETAVDCNLCEFHCTN